MIKPFFQVLTVVAALAGGMTVAVAADGNNGKGKGSESSESGGKADKSDKSDKSESKADKPDKSTDGGKPATAGTSAKPNAARVPAIPKGKDAVVPEDVLPQTSADALAVLPEVMTEDALSLSEVRSALALVSNGRMLDIALAEVDGRMVYQVTVLERGNVARQIVIDARSGLEVGDPR